MNHEDKKRFIAARFPQLQQLTKPGWADAACEVWAKAWELSTWEDLDKVPANPLTPTASLLNHCSAVVDNCIQVARSGRPSSATSWTWTCSRQASFMTRPRYWSTSYATAKRSSADPASSTSTASSPRT